MLLESFLHRTRNMSISHLFFDTKQMTIFNTLQRQHPRFKLHNLTNHTQAFPPSEILLIELGESTKEKLKILLGVLSKSKPIITYIFADDVENKLLLKFALHFGITDVLPLRNEESLLGSIFTKSPNKIDEKLHIFDKLDIEQKMEYCFAFFTFKDTKLAYANLKAQTLFGETNLHTIEEDLYADEDIARMLNEQKDAQSIIVIETQIDKKTLYLCTLTTFPHKKDEKILTMIEYDEHTMQGNCSSVLNRFDFIEKLKDTMVQQSITERSMSLIFITISNLDKLTQTFTNIHLYEALKFLLSKITQLKSAHQEIAQWSPNLYVLLCEHCTFEEACEQTRFLQEELVQTTLEQKITPIIVSSTLCTQNLSLNDLLKYIDKISAKSLLPSDVEKLKFYEIEYLENVRNPKEQIAYLMRNCINNKIPLKLLNIYKGLCINTSSHIIKYSDDVYHLYCENLQGYAMQIEGETVIQAPNFPKDIKAEISLVDIKKSFVVIKNLTFMANSANNRQHTRVQTSLRTPVHIKYAQKSSMQGEIIDISVNSIAMKCNKSLKDTLLNQNAKLYFSLPYEEGENGYVAMEVEGKITFVFENDEFTKVVLLLNPLKKPFDDYLLNYMYARQKELILEIKRATKVYN